MAEEGTGRTARSGGPDISTIDTKQWLRESQRVARIGHYVLDIAGDRWIGSDSLAEVFGTVGPACGTIGDWLTLVHPDDRDRMAAYYADQVLAHGERFDIEYRVVRPADGRTRWVHGIGTVERDDQGNPSRMFGVIQDVTESHEALEALRASEDKFKHLFEHSVVPKSLTEPDGTIHVNDAFCEMLGYTREELGDGATWQQLSHPDDQELTKSYVDSLLRGECASARFEKRYIRKDGSIAWADVATSLRRSPDGTPEYFMTTILDISERKEAEKRLRDSESKLARVLGFARIGSWTWDMRTDTLEWSDEMFRLYGVDPDGFTGSLGEVIASAIHPDDRATVEAANVSVMQDGTPTPLQYRVVWPDGSVHVIWAQAGELIRDEEGRPALLSGFAQDVTERALAEARVLALNAELESRVQERTEELQATNEELHAANEELQSAIADLAEANERLAEATAAKNEFLAAMSHELRTPLNSIIGFSTVMLQHLAGPLSDEQQRQLRMINASGRHLLELINEVLDLAKLESHLIRPSFSAVDVCASVEVVQESLRPLAEAKSVGLVRDCPAGLPMAVTDAVRLDQILFNLVGNAIKFTDAGHVRSSVRSVAGGLEVEVADTGCGIDPQDVERIFDDFYQVPPHSSARSEGTGLGLTVSRRLAESIGARIRVESTPGAGSRFTLSLPLDAAAVVDRD